MPNSQNKIESIASSSYSPLFDIIDQFEVLILFRVSYDSVTINTLIIQVEEELNCTFFLFQEGKLLSLTLECCCCSSNCVPLFQASEKMELTIL